MYCTHLCHRICVCEEQQYDIIIEAIDNGLSDIFIAKL